MPLVVVLLAGVEHRHLLVPLVVVLLARVEHEHLTDLLVHMVAVSMGQCPSPRIEIQMEVEEEASLQLVPRPVASGREPLHLPSPGIHQLEIQSHSTC